MATAHETDKLETEVFGLFRELEESVVEAGRKWAKAVGDAVPVDMPVVRELVKGAFEFGEEFFKAQREFTLGVLKLTRQAAPPVRRSTPRSPAHRATPRTTPRTRSTTKAA